MKKVLVSREIPLPHLDPYKDYFTLDMLRDDQQDQLEVKLKEADYFIACNQWVDKSLLDWAPKLEAVNSYGVGYDAINLEDCRQRGVKVSNTPNAVTQPTAELALALMLGLCRRVCEIDEKMRNDTVEWGLLKNQGISLHGRRLGIVGLGRIGKRLAGMALAMGMEVVYHNRRQLSPQEEKEGPYRYLALDELLQTSDIVSLHTPYSPSSHHLIDGPALEKMKEEAYLINTARGPVVDEEALVAALEAGKIQGAGLDVFEKEPRVHPRLKTLRNTILLPHIGTDTLRVATQMTQEALDGFLLLEKGQTPPNLVE